MCAFAALAVTTAYAWDPKEIEERHEKAQAAKTEMLEKDPNMQRFFDSAAAYVIIPTVGKGGIGIGGARGKGLLYEGGNIHRLPVGRAGLQRIHILQGRSGPGAFQAR